ncbi:hypothetical protein NNC19_15025 [Clostridium sp. SHJSY1]|uniref:hypothetical protein n=1 Tax=Clostridium sp. SHJSY1 TaxID=2942483 RepID=UPI002875CAA9|nr:hypothetical protein [Clostridium sp. SHJSY1]MDS0527004.1 hypothetical protein [Clostridium sp. SHJSY1]
MKKLLSFILCLILGLTLISCSSSKDKETENNKPEEITNTAKDSTTKQEDTKSDTRKDTKTENENTTKVEEKKSSLVTLKTYTADEENLSIKTLSSIQIEDNLSLKDKLTQLANELSSKNFSGLPIKVVNVETINGSKKATINLENLTTDNSISWTRTYFQGTTGGAITTKSLIETFKQSSYTGDWINYVEFLYNNEKIEYEHVQNLENVIKLR